MDHHVYLSRLNRRLLKLYLDFRRHCSILLLEPVYKSFYDNHREEMKNFMKLVLVATIFGLFSAGCGDSGAGTDPDATVDTDSQIDIDSSQESDGQAHADADHNDGGATDAELSDAESCNREQGPDDVERKIVVSKPYESGGETSDTYESVDMNTEGGFSFPGTNFSLVRSITAKIEFTPDGKVGIVPQEDGTLGVFGVENDGSVSVIHESFSGNFYASKVIMDPDGERVYVLDTQWRENGGGIYSLKIECDGSLMEEGLWAPAQLPYAMIFLPDESRQVVVAAKDILDSQEGENIHLLQWSQIPNLIDSVDGFGHNDFIIESFAVTQDGKYVLFGNNASFSEEPNSIAVVEVETQTLSPIQLLSPIEDPFDIVTSPYNNAAMVISGFGDAVLSLSYDPSNSAAPFTIGETVSSPALPAKTVSIGRGQLTGWVFISENMGIRKLVFETNGSITDLGATGPGSGLENMIGSIKIQP